VSATMNIRLLKSLFYSLGLHMAAWSLLGLGVSAEYGFSRLPYSSPTAHPQLTVRITGVGKQPDQGLPRKAVEPEITVASEIATKAEGKDRATGVSPDAESIPDYVPVGRLTRPPVLLTDIDLNVADISEVGITGQLELTLFIDANGSVADVITSTKMEDARLFAERVVRRFKSSRFKPGEIDGKVVNSRLEIMVISEACPTCEHTAGGR